MYKRVVVKVGSGVISRDGALDMHVLEELTGQIATLREKGLEIVLVTSGAVAVGRESLELPRGVDSVVAKQVFASIGQVQLMSRYAALFNAHGLACAQVLVTKEDFRDRTHYLNMKNCLENLLASGVVPVVNENDVIAVTELIFTDNDELAGLLASQLDADAVFILTSVEGVVKGDPKDPQAEVIPEIDPSDDSFSRHITSDRSLSGRGGMHTKFGIAKRLATQGIATHIANGRRANVLIDLADGKPLGTRFIPQRKLSSLKRRIAHSEAAAKGSVVVNECTTDLLTERKIMSLLPVGITEVRGSFGKGDIIEIQGAKGRRLGLGVAQYDSEKAATAAGKKNGRALVHYDYLFIE